MKRLRLLVTGFSAFPDVPLNPTQVLVEDLDVFRLSRRLGVDVAASVLPTEYEAVSTLLPALWKEVRPDAVLHLGLHGRAATVRVETRAVNRRSLAARDARGERPASPHIERGGPAVRIATFPSARIAAAIAAGGVPAVLSRDAGRYLCNYASYLSLGLAPEGAVAGFVHLPWPAEMEARKAPSVRPGWNGLERAVDIAVSETAKWARMSAPAIQKKA